MSFKKKLSSVFNTSNHTTWATVGIVGTVAGFSTLAFVPALSVLGVSGIVVGGLNGIFAGDEALKTKPGKAAIAFAKAAPKKAATRVKKLFGRKPGL